MMAVFESSMDDPLGIWQSEINIGQVSFAIDDASPDEMHQVFRVNLPSAGRGNSAIFDASEALFDRVNDAVISLPAKLDSYAVYAAKQTPASSESFSVDGNYSFLDEAQRELYASLQMAVTDGNPLASKPDNVDFAITEGPSRAWQETKKRFEQLVIQVDQDALHLAWVETAIEKQLVARTVLDWNGNSSTIWFVGADPAQNVFHQRSLVQATRSRLLRIQLFITIASGAARLASLLAIPGGAALALPAVYQYATRILAQAREIQTLPNIL